ncbi:hypothetical protein ACFLZ1_04785 [Patescibacteria group bacterium]
MKYKDCKKRILAANKLLKEKTTNRQKFESIRTLIKGINPQIDKQLALTSKALKKIEKIKKGKVIDLALESLPEKSKKDEKRKKALLLFLKRWKQLKSEVKKVNKELKKHQNFQESSLVDKVSSASKIIAKAKGPFGLITITAVVIVGSTLFITSRKPANDVTKPVSTPTSIPEVVSKQTIKVVIFKDKQIPLTELVAEEGINCTEPHYHSKDDFNITALDGSIVYDPHPEACGFGKVEDLELMEIPE